MRMFADLSGFSERGLYTTLRGCLKSSQLGNSAPNFFRPGAADLHLLFSIKSEFEFSPRNQKS